MVALTGTPQQVGRAAKAFRVYFSDVDREDDEDDYIGKAPAGCFCSTSLISCFSRSAVDHSIVMYLMDKDGKIVDFYTQLAEAPEVIERISEELRLREKKPGFFG